MVELLLHPATSSSAVSLNSTTRLSAWCRRVLFYCSRRKNLGSNNDTGNKLGWRGVWRAAYVLPCLAYCVVPPYHHITIGVINCEQSTALSLSIFHPSLASPRLRAPIPAPTTMTVLNSQTRWAGAPKGPWSLRVLCILHISSAAALRGLWLQLHSAGRCHLLSATAATANCKSPIFHQAPHRRLHQCHRILGVDTPAVQLRGAIHLGQAAA